MYKPTHTHTPFTCPIVHGVRMAKKTKRQREDKNNRKDAKRYDPNKRPTRPLVGRRGSYTERR